MKLSKPKNPGAVQDGDQWYIYDAMQNRIIESHYDLWRADHFRKVLQEHADRNGHAADYKCIRVDEVWVQ